MFGVFHSVSEMYDNSFLYPMLWCDSDELRKFNNWNVSNINVTLFPFIIIFKVLLLLN